MSSPPFLKNWLEVQPPPPLAQKSEEGRGCTLCLLCNFFWDRQNALIGLNYTELQKISTQYKHTLYS